MSILYDNKSLKKNLMTTQNIILTCMSLGILALLYYLLFSAKVVVDSTGVEKREQWYLIGTNIFEALAFLIAGVLCLRNWRSPQIVSGSLLWVTMGIGMLSNFLGGVIFGYIEIFLGQEPFPSIADIFYVATYLFVGAGMILAVTSRKINLEATQWGIIATIGLVGSFFAWWISLQQTTTSDNIATILNWFYVVSDVLLLILATTLLLAFWGGRVALSWRMIAIAAFSLYIADMWFKFATTSTQNFQSGELLEVFWVFSGVLFGMGAALEYDASLNRARRTSGRKRF